MKRDHKPSVVEDIVVEIPTGLHVRPAGDLVQAIEKLHADISIECRGERVNGKSIMGLLTLAAEHGTTVRVFAEGPDAEIAVESIRRVLANGPKPD
jgi:phosphotransferase system HPr (HPr) family protein